MEITNVRYHKKHTFYITINIPWCHEVHIFCLWLEYASPSTQLPVVQWLATLQMNRQNVHYH